MKADAMLDKGDLDGAAIWRQIVAAINELQREKLKPGEMRHKISCSVPLRRAATQYRDARPRETSGRSGHGKVERPVSARSPGRPYTGYTGLEGV